MTTRQARRRPAVSAALAQRFRARATTRPTARRRGRGKADGEAAEGVRELASPPRV